MNFIWNSAVAFYMLKKISIYENVDYYRKIENKKKLRSRYVCVQ